MIPTWRASGAASFLLLASTLVAGCAPALRKLPDLPPSPGGAPGTAETKRIEAESRFATRRIEEVRRAAVLWLEAGSAQPQMSEAWLGASRAESWLAEHEPTPEGRLAAAESAAMAAQRCRAAAPNEPACDFWLGVALGHKARERPVTGLAAIPEMVEAFRKAAAAAPTLEEGGPDRALAFLYLRAPGWPIGPGDPDLGLEHAMKAVAINATFPPNQIALGEALRETGSESESREAYLRALDLARRKAQGGAAEASEWIREAEEALQRGQRD